MEAPPLVFYSQIFHQCVNTAGVMGHVANAIKLSLLLSSSSSKPSSHTQGRGTVYKTRVVTCSPAYAQWRDNKVATPSNFTQAFHPKRSSSLSSHVPNVITWCCVAGIVSVYLPQSHPHQTCPMSWEVPTNTQ